MIKFCPITTSNMQHYKFMEELLIESFPPEEYRQLDKLREYTDKKNNFVNNIIFNDELPIGFITYWDLDNFYYIEHFATNKALRNGGYGKLSIEHFCHLSDRPIVLEVEKPKNEMAKRRINFYQRQGFKLWHKEYFQPPYKEEDHNIPMYLMVYGNLNEKTDYEEVKTQIHNIVYGQNK